MNLDAMKNIAPAEVGRRLATARRNCNLFQKETAISIAQPVGVNATTAPGSEQEWKKAITTWLLPGPSHVLIDNVEGQLRSESLCTALTTNAWSDRLMGGNMQALLPINCQWIMTSNNAQLHEDLVTRSVLIRLDSRTEPLPEEQHDPSWMETPVWEETATE